MSLKIMCIATAVCALVACGGGDSAPPPDGGGGGGGSDARPFTQKAGDLGRRDTAAPADSILFDAAPPDTGPKF